MNAEQKSILENIKNNNKKKKVNTKKISLVFVARKEPRTLHYYREKSKKLSKKNFNLQFKINQLEKYKEKYWKQILSNNSITRRNNYRK